MNNKKSLLAVLGRRDYEKIPNDIIKKIEKCFSDVHTALATSKGDCNKAKKDSGKYTLIPKADIFVIVHNLQP